MKVEQGLLKVERLNINERENVAVDWLTNTKVFQNPCGKITIDSANIKTQQYIIIKIIKWKYIELALVDYISQNTWVF